MECQVMKEEVIESIRRTNMELRNEKFFSKKGSNIHVHACHTLIFFFSEGALATLIKNNHTNIILTISAVYVVRMRAIGK